MNNRAAAIVVLLVAGGVLLLGARSGGPIDDGTDGGSPFSNWNLDALMDNVNSLFNRASDAVASPAANVPADRTAVNLAAWQAVVKAAEGGDYATCFGYKHTISNFADHPAVTGEWTGERLSDDMCANAGYGPGCVSTAAGAYQIKKGTWIATRDALGLPDFSPASQDAAMLELTRQRGALEAVKAGDLATAVYRCRNEWASLPGNYAKQGQRSLEQLQAWFAQAGGQAVLA